MRLSVVIHRPGVDRSAIHADLVERLQENLRVVLRERQWSGGSSFTCVGVGAGVAGQEALVLSAWLSPWRWRAACPAQSPRRRPSTISTPIDTGLAAHNADRFPGPLALPSERAAFGRLSTAATLLPQALLLDFVQRPPFHPTACGGARGEGVEVAGSLAPERLEAVARLGRRRRQRQAVPHPGLPVTTMLEVETSITLIAPAQWLRRPAIASPSTYVGDVGGRRPLPLSPPAARAMKRAGTFGEALVGEDRTGRSSAASRRPTPSKRAITHQLASLPNSASRG